MNAAQWAGRMVRQDYAEEHAREALLELTRLEQAPAGHKSGFGVEWSDRVRPSLVCWALDLCEHYCLALPTAGLTVALIDRVAPEVGNSRPLLQAIALACLSLAAKLEEAEADAPSVKALAHASRDCYTPEQLARCELSVLHLLGWHVRLPTAAHFLEIFLAMPESASNCALSRELRDSLSNECGVLINRALEQLRLAALTKPSILAAGILMLARSKLHLQPWPSDLAAVTGLHEHDIQHTAKAIHQLEHNNSVLSQDHSPAFNADDATVDTPDEHMPQAPSPRDHRDGSVRHEDDNFILQHYSDSQSSLSCWSQYSQHNSEGALLDPPHNAECEQSQHKSDPVDIAPYAQEAHLECHGSNAPDSKREESVSPDSVLLGRLS